MSRLLSRLEGAQFALLLFVPLFLATVFITPSRFSYENLGITLGLMVPLILAACAATPVIVGGREGIDLSVGPLIGVINVILVKWIVLDAGITTPFVIVPAALVLGVFVGAVNGWLAVYLGVQPIVATLGTFLILSGIATWILPSPMGPAPDWLIAMSEGLSFIPLLVVAAGWYAFKKLPLHGLLFAIGNDDRGAYAAGVNVNLVRFSAYLVTGAIAAVAALSLTALLGSADAQVGPDFTLLAIAAAALGGVSLAGGKGRMTGAALGAVDIFLLQNLITHFNVSPFAIRITYGLVLVVAVVLNSERIAAMFARRRSADA